MRVHLPGVPAVTVGQMGLQACHSAATLVAGAVCTVERNSLSVRLDWGVDNHTSAKVVSCTYPCTSVTVSNKHQDMHSEIY